MKKVVVTGGSGFIGSNLVNYLIQKKFFVINIDKQNLQIIITILKVKIINYLKLIYKKEIVE